MNVMEKIKFVAGFVGVVVFTLFRWVIIAGVLIGIVYVIGYILSLLFR